MSKEHKHGDNFGGGVDNFDFHCHLSGKKRELAIKIKGEYTIEDTRLLDSFKLLLNHASIPYSCESRATIDCTKAPFNMASFNCSGGIRKANYPSKVITTIKILG